MYDLIKVETVKNTVSTDNTVTIKSAMKTDYLCTILSLSSASLPEFQRSVVPTR